MLVEPDADGIQHTVRMQFRPRFLMISVNCLVPQRFGVLGNWVSTEQIFFKRGTLLPERKEAERDKLEFVRKVS